MSRTIATVILLAQFGSVATTSAADVRLRYVGRYDTQSAYHDHLMAVEQVGAHHVLVSSNLDIVTVDLDDLKVNGTQTYVDRLAGLDVSNTVMGPDGYLYANLRMGGLAVVHLDEQFQLSLIDTVSEPSIFFEKMSIVGDRLYVSAHANGIRIFDVTNPAQPTLVGSLEEGFDDAFAIAVDGTVGYVADGAGGLKVVDLSNETAPVIVAGENPVTAAATAEDVLVIDHDVYLACGGDGVAFYSGGALESRILYDTPIAARQLAAVGTHIAVADIGGLEVFDRADGGTLTRVAGESGQRRSAGGESVTLRLWEGVAAWGDDHILVADWDSMDLYQLVDPATDDQPDVTVSTHRVRFAPDGGSTVIKLRNDGSAPLTVTDIASSQTTFVVQPTEAILEPGEQIDVSIDYAGGSPGTGLILITSDDPDESPLPIQVYGDTVYLDPGEPTLPFSLESWRFDHEAREFTQGMFDLDDHAGQVVFMHIFGLG